VKKLRKSSKNNSKADYIQGRSLQALALLAGTRGGPVRAVPLISRIH